jgi:single-stranded-DNA-specific exonuclease
MRVEQHGVVMRGVAFGAGEWEKELDTACRQGPVSVAYRPVINAYRGRRSVELHLADWRQQAVAVAVD